jgi:predicted transcriptional regulator
MVKAEAAVTLIKELWTTTDIPVADIAMEIGRPRQTVEALIKHLIERNELAQRAESGQQISEKV